MNPKLEDIEKIARSIDPESLPQCVFAATDVMIGWRREIMVYRGAQFYNCSMSTPEGQITTTRSLCGLSLTELSVMPNGSWGIQYEDHAEIHLIDGATYDIPTRLV